MKNVGIIKYRDGDEFKFKYELFLPDKLAEWDVWDYWEKERFQSLQENLTPNSIIFDIGSEIGWTSAIISKYFTPKIALIEPSVDFSPITKEMWTTNRLEAPLFIFNGFASSKTDKLKKDDFGWKEGKESPYGRPYKYLHKHDDTELNIPKATIDELSNYTGIIPDAINIDIEGAEFEALKGCDNLLRTRKPLVWVSIHTDLLQRDYGGTTDEIIKLMEFYGYESYLLATDHESHFIFTPKK